jgi:UDP-N-acetylglucosamine 2-epimerase (non-hydrolysing)
MTGSPRMKTLDPDDLEEKVCVVVGTRPGIVMFSPVIRELRRRGLPTFVLHTGQHYSYNMDRQFFEELGLPEPDHKLRAVRHTQLHGQQTAVMLRGSEDVLLRERPRLVLVGGDANTNLAAALAARKLHIPVGHVEAGERSYDWRMPEEHNRVIIDHISEYLFATNAKGRENLRADNVRGQVIVTGNPIVDATHQNRAVAERYASVTESLGVQAQQYFLMTLHREENVDSKQSLERILRGVALARAASNWPVVFTVHPRTRRRLREFGLLRLAESVEGLLLIDAVGYLEFLNLLSGAALVLTDSGGVQQESCILGVPCVTLRDNTEWTETVMLGANAVAGTTPHEISRAVARMLTVPTDWENPFGDGHAAARIVDVVESALDPSQRWTGPGHGGPASADADELQALS